MPRRDLHNRGGCDRRLELLLLDDPQADAVTEQDDELVCIAFGLGELSEVEAGIAYPVPTDEVVPRDHERPRSLIDGFRPVLEGAFALEHDGADIAAIELDGDVDALAEPVAQPEQSLIVGHGSSAYESLRPVSN
jgi:hypothetical protein